MVRMRLQLAWRNMALLFLVAFLIAPLSLWAKDGTPATGEVRWFDLLTEDAETASSFYSELFGWQMQETESGALLALHDGIPVAAISKIEDTLQDTAEATWLVGIIVKDVAAATKTAERLGAKVLEEVTRYPGWGIYSVLEDPQGAEVLLLVTERPMGGSEGPGAFVWAELWTQDVKASSSFYSEVIGYQISAITRPHGDYPIFATADEPRAGLVEIEDKKIETSWAPYVGVAQLAESLQRVGELGGKVLLAPDEQYGGGRVALIADPTGAGLFLYELDRASP